MRRACPAPSATCTRLPPPMCRARPERADSTRSRYSITRAPPRLTRRRPAPRPAPSSAIRIDAGLRERIQTVPERHAVDRAGVAKPPEVVVHPEDPRTVRRLVAADPLEDARPVVHDVAHHVDGRVLPAHELTVTPDLRGATGRSRHALPRVGSATR